MKKQTQAVRYLGLTTWKKDEK